MKKPLLCLAAYVMLFSACTGKKNSPQEITLDFFNVLYNEHDLEKAEAYCTEESKEKLRSTIRAIEGAIQLTDEDEITEYKYEIVEERSEIKNDSAFMTVRSSLDTSTMKIMLIKINEEWKVDFDYEEPVIDKGLIDELLEVMKPFSDSITVEMDTTE